MSTLLEQAIIDATALKEAALKSAESSILEKYAPEVRDAVSSLLEQEDDFMDMEDAEEGEDEAFDTLAAAEGEKLCPCPDDDEKIEVDFDELNALMAEEPMGETTDIGQEVEAAPEEPELELTEAILEALEVTEGKKPRILKRDGDYVLRAKDDAGEYMVGKKDASDDKFYHTDDMEDAEATLKDMASRDKKPTGKKAASKMDEGRCPECKGKGKECKCPDKEEKMDEDIELTEENIDAILEELVVDLKPMKRGWAGTPDSIMNFNAELELARLASTEAQEEIKVLKQALSNVKKDYAQLSESNEGTRTMNKRLANTVSSIKDKLEEVNLVNARLFYTNRVLNSSSLNERQKSKIAEAISESRSVNEAKIVFETLQNAVGTSPKRTPKSLSEAINRTSPLMARRESSSSADTSAVQRMQRLAGITNK
jgi:uncharacterized protein YukE